MIKEARTGGEMDAGVTPVIKGRTIRKERLIFQCSFETV
jgi:hypothetical protein